MAEVKKKLKDRPRFKAVKQIESKFKSNFAEHIGQVVKHAINGLQKSTTAGPSD